MNLKQISEPNDVYLKLELEAVVKQLQFVSKKY